MNISFLNLKRENERYASQIKEVVSRVIDSGWYILGKEKEQFEREFAQYCGVKHCIGVGNGLDALRLILIGYMEQGVMQEGDEVILPANTFIATALAVSQCHLTPVLADCDINTYNTGISPNLSTKGRKLHFSCRRSTHSPSGHASLIKKFSVPPILLVSIRLKYLHCSSLLKLR